MSFYTLFFRQLLEIKKICLQTWVMLCHQTRAWLEHQNLICDLWHRLIRQLMQNMRWIYTLFMYIFSFVSTDVISVSDKHKWKHLTCKAQVLSVETLWLACLCKYSLLCQRFDYLTLVDMRLLFRWLQTPS